MPAAPAKLPTLEWRPQARADLMDIVAFVAEDNPDAAQELKDEIESKAANLARQPKLSRRSQRVKGLREVVIRRNYILLYRESPALVEIVNVVHARRQWPALRSAKPKGGAL